MEGEVGLLRVRLVGVCLVIGVWEDGCGGEWGLEGGVGLPRVR